MVVLQRLPTELMAVTPWEKLYYSIHLWGISNDTALLQGASRDRPQEHIKKKNYSLVTIWTSVLKVARKVAGLHRISRPREQYSIKQAVFKHLLMLPFQKRKGVQRG